MEPLVSRVFRNHHLQGPAVHWVFFFTSSLIVQKVAPVLAFQVQSVNLLLLSPLSPVGTVPFIKELLVEAEITKPIRV
ncbi:hypothetical protein BDV38DRAFT_61288 [Aspergillus pseudotamarii]|uniref:Uncharacterized protein n=1 Tax=Aspergillus pseudotamarii TaxID=132259 RepID=A0A5N6SYJ8_ASPPS|nr:uncharacterized protein BDV38DRAFT_61288 [Aspergillus pseudotamarii]KAE8138830.1 hypothetical protein BDV38DRAFT_61288 [Aspergillus pseudotamarii]